MSNSLRPHGLLVHHQLLEFTQTHVHWVGDAIQSSHPLSSPSPYAFNLSQHQGLFKWLSSSHQVAKVLEFQLQHQSFQWKFRKAQEISLKVKITQSCPTLWPPGLYSPWNSSVQNTGVGSCSLLQGIFPTQVSNPGLLHCKRILYQLSHQGSPGDTVSDHQILNMFLYISQHCTWLETSWSVLTNGNVNVNDALLCVQGGYEHVWVSALPCYSMKAAWTSEIPLKKTCLSCTWLRQE